VRRCWSISNDTADIDADADDVYSSLLFLSAGIPTAFPNNADEDRILVSSLRGRRAVTNMSEYLWKDGIIPYRFSESVKEGRHCMHFQVVVRLPTAVKIDLGLRFICPTI
jgi:hypothetical protein